MISLKLKKTFSDAKRPFLLDIDMTIQAGTFATLYGESGAGKTTLLRMIAGLMEPDEGVLTVGDREFYRSASKTNLRPQDRDVAMVFQEGALFPNMTVKKNLLFAAPKHVSQEFLVDVMERLHVKEFADRFPDSLSGGQKQRVALARALMQRPSVLLLDEPLSSLDAGIRHELQDVIRDMHDSFGLTTILVTHDMAEVHRLSDRVYVLENGRIAREGRPMDVFFEQQISGKFKFTGEILSIEQDGVVHIVSVLILQQIVKVIAQPSDVAVMNIGDRVIVASKAFNPVIFKID